MAGRTWDFDPMRVKIRQLDADRKVDHLTFPTSLSSHCDVGGFEFTRLDQFSQQKGQL
jgi:hypothetical protein